MRSGDTQQQYNAIIALRNLATKVENKRAISEAGAIKELLAFLDIGDENPLTIVAAETLSCLAADDPPNMVRLPKYGGTIQGRCTLNWSAPLNKYRASYIYFASTVWAFTAMDAFLSPSALA